jgi:hypothetical protein
MKIREDFGAVGSSFDRFLFLSCREVSEAHPEHPLLEANLEIKL